MPFSELSDFFAPELRLPVRGKVYVIPSPDAATGLWLNGIYGLARTHRAGLEPSRAELAGLMLDDDDEHDLYRRVLGPVFDELAADGVSWHEIEHVGKTALIWVAVGEDEAEQFWNLPRRAEGKAPKAPADRKPPARKRAAKKAASRGGSTTRQPSQGASSPGTRS